LWTISGAGHEHAMCSTTHRRGLEAITVVCGFFDESIAPSLAERAGALLLLATERPVPRLALAVAAHVAARANQPAAEAALVARRAIAAQPGPL
jgi:hypothetical protein